MTNAKVDCPHCVNSSGYVALTRSNMHDQTCDICKGKGVITTTQRDTYFKRMGLMSNTRTA